MKYYCIGIKGTGMSTLAQMLYDMGNEVCGYDDERSYKFTEEGLKKRNIPIYYDGNHSLEKDTIVTFSRAFQSDHKEIKRVKELGLKIKPYNEILGEITKAFESICVCGTHGKTTTTSLVKHILEHTEGCNYFIGDGSGKINKNQSLLVIESDEFNRHFLAYHPIYSLVTCIELEHTEIYDSIEDIIKTFETFVNQSKCIIANGSDKNVRKIHFTKEVIFYGKEEENDYQICDVHLTEDGSSFCLMAKGKKIGPFHLPLYGYHMIENATAAIIMCLLRDIPVDTIQALLLTSKNAARRFQEEKIGNTVIIDDYAHHPTEIKVTLEAIRQKYKDKHLSVVFRPNTYSRTARFKKEFAESLKIADKVFMTPILCDREKKEDYEEISSEDVLALIPGGELIDENSIEKLLPYKDGVIAFMGCATVSHLIERLKERL